MREFLRVGSAREQYDQSYSAVLSNQLLLPDRMVSKMAEGGTDTTHEFLDLVDTPCSWLRVIPVPDDRGGLNCARCELS